MLLVLLVLMLALTLLLMLLLILLVVLVLVLDVVVVVVMVLVVAWLGLLHHLALNCGCGGDDGGTHWRRARVLKMPPDLLRGGVDGRRGQVCVRV